ncbi:uncharacterized Fe-S center protein [Sphaerochaeta pleomorpha str. Grapes]|uniref:Uncharacterized Fe-S center protein n=1 Tax=Sphaerochaeta pleomorpha (strain ATCC BAA-1885 / DSM 22778 / Grapes) TaxID=158190 RepID=G8QSK5_SPHPG|nr:DUF362 domain-containing protein [Sphaerochaeta pleomorpha]AEV28966.1 uncharacterized Fe-S center protein [Sphaerochaeta pleomorpha str. Grapes]
MKPSDVYFINLRCKDGDSRLTKLERLIKKAGIGKIDMDGKFVAIKIHFGEPGNLAFLRPNYAATVVQVIKELGGRPFLTDCNTLYVGGRKNALDHIDSAYKNGYSPYATGCQVIIADGLKGTDEALIPVPSGEYVKEAKIGRALADADIIVSLAHFKGHEGTGFGGALKNLGMGGGSRAGKMEQHSDGKPYVDQDLCIGCGNCVRICAHDAPVITNRKASIDHDKCVGCGRCIGVCPKDAVQPGDGSSNDKLNCKISEYAMAVCEGKPNFHINVVIDISPFCDCHSENDVSIVPDVGMFASFDPVALDRACVDAVNAQPPIMGSRLGEVPQTQCDHLTNSQSSTNWRVGLDHAQKIGLGTQEYRLVTIQ